MENVVFENSALFFSGGLHDEYSIDDSIKKNKYCKLNDQDLIPDIKELNEIIYIAIQRKSIIGCYIENVKYFLNEKFIIIKLLIIIKNWKFFNQEEIAKKFGVYLEHLYLITDSIEYDKKTLLKIHNPLNTKDDIKKLKLFIWILHMRAMNFSNFIF